ncbi:hypothetical protein E2C01_000174 [Portunus trituberculatus]|uniref:Uncharacterized protein n=1 Tax=Portunus trituberculatus TaxID=210409 RepID=A0A5B7CFU2_PORTR|nr:hypothetical protein [Portunus trituberculatus]
MISLLSMYTRVWEPLPERRRRVAEETSSQLEPAGQQNNTKSGLYLNLNASVLYSLAVTCGAFVTCGGRNVPHHEMSYKPLWSCHSPLILHLVGCVGLGSHQAACSCGGWDGGGHLYLAFDASDSFVYCNVLGIGVGVNSSCYLCVVVVAGVGVAPGQSES